MRSSQFWFTVTFVVAFLAVGQAGEPSRLRPARTTATNAVALTIVTNYVTVTNTIPQPKKAKSGWFQRRDDDWTADPFRHIEVTNPVRRSESFFAVGNRISYSHSQGTSTSVTTDYYTGRPNVSQSTYNSTYLNVDNTPTWYGNPGTVNDPNGPKASVIYGNPPGIRMIQGVIQKKKAI